MSKTALVTGNFNILHLGHIRLLQFAKKCAETLIVAVNSDSMAGQEVQIPEELRMETVKSIGCVDDVIINRQSVNDLIEKIKPDIIVKGREFELRDNDELKVLKKYGGKLMFSSGETSFSNERNFQDESMELNRTKNMLLQYMARHNIKHNKLVEIVEEFEQKNILVIGDLIIDEYVDCYPLGMSEEDPTIVVTPTNRKKYVGGAGIVALHAAGLGAQVSFVTLTGKDEDRDFAATSLEEHNIDFKFLVDPTRVTTLKQRFRSSGKTLLRVSNLNQQSISQDQQDLILSEVEKRLHNTHVLIFSDFNYGVLPQSLVENILKKVERFDGIICAADSQSSSQTGDIKRFKRMNLITPTEKEARLSLRNNEDGLVILADEIQKNSNAENVFLKLGADGVLLHSREPKKKTIVTDRLDALNINPVDVSGAGDSMLTSASLALACGADIWSSGLIGSFASALQVSRVGNIPLSKNQLTEIINR